MTRDEMIRSMPAASAQQVVDALREKGIEVSRSTVWSLRSRDRVAEKRVRAKPARARPAVKPGNGATHASESDDAALELELQRELGRIVDALAALKARRVLGKVFKP